MLLGLGLTAPDPHCMITGQDVASQDHSPWSGFFLPWPVCNGKVFKMYESQIIKHKALVSRTAPLPMDICWWHQDPKTLACTPPTAQESATMPADSFWSMSMSDDGVCIYPNSKNLYRAVTTSGSQENRQFEAFAAAWKTSCPETDCHFEFGKGDVCSVPAEYGGPGLTTKQRQCLSLKPEIRTGAGFASDCSGIASASVISAAPAYSSTAASSQATPVQQVSVAPTVQAQPTVTASHTTQSGSQYGTPQSFYQQLAQSMQPSSPYSVRGNETLSFDPSGAVIGTQGMQTSDALFAPYQEGYKPPSAAEPASAALANPLTPASSGGSSGLLMLAAAAGAAYFLFFKGGRK